MKEYVFPVSLTDDYNGYFQALNGFVNGCDAVSSPDSRQCLFRFLQFGKIMPKRTEKFVN